MDDGLLKGTAGYTPFEDLIKNYVVSQDTFELSPQEQKRIAIIDKIVVEYLNTREQLLFRLATETTKTITDIQNVMGYHTFQTTERHIQRVFKMIRCYYLYESLDKESLEAKLKKMFNRQERRIISLLHQRFTIFEIKDKIRGLHYRKANKMKNDIIEKLNQGDKECKQYAKFLTGLRQFRRLGDI